jgi:hypothetical protein
MREWSLGGGMPSPEHVRPRPSVPSLPSPRRGGLRTPTMKASRFRHGALSPLATGPFVCPQMIMLCPGLRPALPRGRTECVPPRKPPLAASPGLPPKGHLTPANPPGGAGSARPRKRLRFRPGDRPIRPPGFRLPPNDYVMPRLASGLTTRTHRVRPSEKTACRAIFGSAPVRPSGLRLAIPRRGGLRTPARKAMPSTGKITPLLAIECSFTARSP